MDEEDEQIDTHSTFVSSEEYDSTILDSFLQRQREQADEEDLSSTDLDKTQIWGHIDPRVVWPKARPENWLVEKRREVDARGGRKARFGKLLTSQVRKERADRGWGPNQNKNRTDEDVVGRIMEGLLGLKNMEDLDLGLHNGRLAMIEKPIDENERPRRRAASKVYYVDD